MYTQPKHTGRIREIQQQLLETKIKQLKWILQTKTKGGFARFQLKCIN